ncbi:MAG: thiamine-phosphate kinase [Neisseria sp.]|uniref:thiamine-phosphate kinase n=1 Tax=Neisseria sp. TaxID=192066 RepID=UPI0026DCBD8B|nr:thiamine-phosphate kinase [Neisseria sp.]MDO4249518.1 thiamine-phosphate kinase [Neisseria sp.]
MNEFDFIRHYLSRQQTDTEVVLGIGDDAAIVRPRSGYDLCFSSDMLLAGRHFFTDVAAGDLAHKVLAVNVSDMAAMGATPRWVLLSAALPYLDEAWLKDFCDTLFDQTRAYDITLIGGDTTRGDWVFNVTIIGELPQGAALCRSGAQPGDDIWVSGYLGAAAAGLASIQGKLSLPAEVDIACRTRLHRPQPRVGLGQHLLNVATSAMDVSDGLAQDLEHILQASAVGAHVEAALLPALPDLRRVLADERLFSLQLAGGDDYELLFTAPQQVREHVLAASRAASVPVSRIGRITDNSGCLEIVDANGASVHLNHKGFDHFG